MEEGQRYRLDMIFGSDRDWPKVGPGVLSATDDYTDLDIRVHFASADNTPEKAAAVLTKIKERDPGVYIAGAGLSNALAAYVRGNTSYSDLVIGVPIRDSCSGGLSSIYSTSERPPGTAVLTVGLNGTYAAANIGRRYMRQEFGGVVLLDTGSVSDAKTKLEEILTEIGLPHVTKGVNEIRSDEIVITPYTADNFSGLGEVAKKVVEGSGVQIAVQIGYDHSANKRPQRFRSKDLSATGTVTMNGYLNAALVAAQLVRDGDAINAVFSKKDERASRLQIEPGFFVRRGEQTVPHSWAE